MNGDHKLILWTAVYRGYQSLPRLTPCVRTYVCPLAAGKKSGQLKIAGDIIGGDSETRAVGKLRA